MNSIPIDRPLVITQKTTSNLADKGKSIVSSTPVATFPDSGPILNKHVSALQTSTSMDASAHGSMHGDPSTPHKQNTLQGTLGTGADMAMDMESTHVT